MFRLLSFLKSIMLKNFYSSAKLFNYIFLFLIISEPFNLNAVGQQIQTNSRKPDKIVKIAVRAHSGIKTATKKWGATVNYLNKSIKGYTFILVPLLTFDEMRNAVKNNEVEFVLTNPTAYIDLSFKYGITRIATLINRRDKNGYSRFGGVAFTSSGRNDINTLFDVKDKSIMGVDKEAFGGWRMLYRELLELDIDPFKDCSKVLFSSTGTHENVVEEVLKGNVDIGTVRTGILESMALSGRINIKDLKIIDRKQDKFPLLHTTRLYPEWPFAVTKNTDTKLAQLVAIKLMQIESNFPAATIGGYTGWEIPQNYSEVLELLKILRVSPFEDYGNISVLNILKRYWYWFLLGLLTVFYLIISLYHIKELNRKLQTSHQEIENKVELKTAQLKNEIEERKIIETTLRESEEKFRLTWEKSNDGMRLTNEEGIVILANDAYCRLMEKPCEEIEGKYLAEVYNSVRRTEILEKHKQRFKSRTILNYLERDIILWNGKKISLELSNSFMDIPGQPTLSLSVFRDITDRKNSENKFKMVYNRLTNVLESMTDGFVSLDENWIYTYVNKKAGDIFGRKPADLVGKHIWTEFPEGIDQPFYKNYYKAFETKKPINFEDYYPPWDRWYENRVIPSEDGLAIFFQDITERKLADKKIKENEEKFSKSFYEHPTPMVIRDLETGDAIDTNKSFIDLFGYDQNKELGRNIFDDAYIHDQSRLLELLSTLKREGKIFNEKLKLIDKSGKFITTLISASILNLDNRKAAIVSIIDVTEREKILQQLDESKTFNETLLNTSPDIIYIYDIIDQKNIYSNKGIANVLGYSVQDIQKIGKNLVAKLMHPDDLEIYFSKIIPLYQTAKDDEIIEHEYRMKHKNGEWRWLHSKESIFKRMDDEKPSQIFGISSDITQQKKAIAKVLESESNLYALINNSEDYIWSLDPDYNYLIFNKKYADVIFSIHGTKLKKGMNAKIHLTPEELELWGKKFEAALQGENISFQFSREISGSELYFETSFNPIYENGVVTGVAFRSADITKRKQAENELNTTLEQLNKSRELLRALNAHVQKIREKERADISREIHDSLGQALTALKMDISWIQKNKEIQNGEISSTLVQMKELIDKTTTSVQRISMELRPGILDDLGLIYALDWQCKEFEKRTDIKTVLRLNPENIVLDENISVAFFRIVQESLTNVARHSKASHAEISLSKNKNKIELKITDNGVGIKEDSLNDPKSLGLLGIRERVYEINGEVGFSNRKEGGTEVKVVLNLK